MEQSRMGRSLVCAWSFLMALSAMGATIHVPGDFPTIQQAIDAANHGDTILVGPGTYIENLVVAEKALTIASEAGNAGTFIVAQDVNEPVVALFATDAGLLTIDGFWLTGGRGGVDMAFGDVVLNDCVIDLNADAPGINIYWSTVSLDNTVVSRNGGSNVLGGGISAHLSTIDVTNCQIDRNRGELGGGAFLSETDAVLTDITFADNEGHDGGGLFLGLTTVTLSNANFAKNVALNNGGAIYSADAFGATLTIQGSGIHGNSAVDGGGVWIGQDAIVEIGQSNFCENTANHIAGNWVDLGDNNFADVCRMGDLNGDGVVDVTDLLLLLAVWGPCPETGECAADLNGDGVVDVSDMLILMANWG